MKVLLVMALLAGLSGCIDREPTPVAPPGPALQGASAQQELCRNTGGKWSSAGGSGLYTCIRDTRDSGKSCVRGSDCEGECLARSGTCAPFTPMLGCQQVLDDNGGVSNLCLN